MDQNQSKPGCLKIILLIIFFPFSLIYLLWKSNLDKKMKIGITNGVLIIFVVWVVFNLINDSRKSSDSNNLVSNDKNEVISTPTVEPTLIPSVSIEQKQADFKEFYAKYKKQAQGMILIQSSITTIAEGATGKADLYLALEELEKTQAGIASANIDMKVPESLKEYKKIGSGLFDFQIGSNNYTDAIKYFKEYVNKEDLTKLSKAKEQIERGNSRLTDSKTQIDSVAKELGIDVSGIQ